MYSTHTQESNGKLKIGDKKGEATHRPTHTVMRRMRLSGGNSGVNQFTKFVNARLWNLCLIGSYSHFTLNTQRVQLKECELVFMQNGNLLIILILILLPRYELYYHYTIEILLAGNLATILIIYTATKSYSSTSMLFSEPCTVCFLH